MNKTYPMNALFGTFSSFSFVFFTMLFVSVVSFLMVLLLVTSTGKCPFAILNTVLGGTSGYCSIFRMLFTRGIHFLVTLVVGLGLFFCKTGPNAFFALFSTETPRLESDHSSLNDKDCKLTDKTTVLTNKTK